MNQRFRQSSRASNILIRPKRPSKRYILRQKPWLKRRFRLIYLKLLRLRGKPEAVAKGLAVGVFAGCFPFFGLQSVLGIILATIFRASRVAAVAATWISNPLTYVPIFVFNYKIGRLVWGTKDTQLFLDLKSFTAFRELGPTFATTLLTGCFIVGLILAFITYFYSLAILERFKTRRHSKLRK